MLHQFNKLHALSNTLCYTNLTNSML